MQTHGCAGFVHYLLPIITSLQYKLHLLSATVKLTIPLVDALLDDLARSHIGVRPSACSFSSVFMLLSLNVMLPDVRP